MTTGLDPAARRVTWSLFERIRDAGTTVVLVTHSMDEAQRLCDRLVVIDSGSVVAAGTPAQLVAIMWSAWSSGSRATATSSRSSKVFRGSRPVRRRGRSVEVTGAPTVVATSARPSSTNGRASRHDGRAAIAGGRLPERGQRTVGPCGR